MVLIYEYKLVLAIWTTTRQKLRHIPNFVFLLQRRRAVNYSSAGLFEAQRAEI